MRYAIKNKGKLVRAYRLGDGSPMERQLLEKGRIREREPGIYELFSLEAVNGEGQLARAGDYFKVTESQGQLYPYPNDREWFEANHRHLRDKEYEQIPKPLRFWQEGDFLWEEVAFLLVFDKITLDPEHQDRYYNAVLWGAPLSAPRDAVIVVYGVDRDEQGHIRDVDFNFVDREVFERDYTILGE